VNDKHRNKQNKNLNKLFVAVFRQQVKNETRRVKTSSVFSPKMLQKLNFLPTKIHFGSDPPSFPKIHFIR
jgi:hypothetical protein